MATKESHPTGRHALSRTRSTSVLNQTSFPIQYYLVFVGIWIEILFVALPIAAVVSIRRRRRNRPGANVIFQYLVLAGWVGAIVISIKLLAKGYWYGGYGDQSPIALQVTVFLAVLVGLHWSLFATSSERKEK